ncbi:hypothetical protein D4S03_03955 [bacterium]|nr:MAG: hypothetical protein D4S03_03955 [bacterium]
MRDRYKQLLSRGRLPQAMSELEEECANAGVGCTAQQCNMLVEMSFHSLDLKKADFWSTKALEIGPDSVTALHHAALVAWNFKEHRSAMEMVRKCLTIEPRHQGAMDLRILLDSQYRTECRPGTMDKIERLRKKKGTLSVEVHTHSDRETDPRMRLLWGDHWVRQELEKELCGLGFDEGRENPDINIHLFGSPAKDFDEDALNMVWLHSHPDMVTIENLRQFDYIFCASSHFLPKLRAMGYVNVEFMPACTAKTPVQAQIEHDMIFLGNARASRPDGRAIVRDMIGTGLTFKVWGNLWEGILPKENYGGRYWDYRRLEELYASAKITLNDHHPDMEREGFVSNKVFDILASGGFVISGKNKGLAAIFKDSVPEYESSEHLKEIVEYYLDNPEERQRLMAKGLKIARTHTYAERAIQFTKGLVI